MLNLDELPHTDTVYPREESLHPRTGLIRNAGIRVRHGLSIVSRVRLKWRLIPVFVVIAALALVPVVAIALVGTPDPLTATAGNDPVVAHLSWGASAEAVRYVVSVATSPDGPYDIVDETEQTEYDYTQGIGGVEYYFRVDAIDVAGERSAPAPAPVGPVMATWVRDPHVKASPSSDKCATCHIPHVAAADPIMRSETAASKTGQTATCLICHDGDIPDVPDVTEGSRDSFAGPSGHRLDPAAPASDMTMNCADCHDAHAVASESPMVPLSVINGNKVTAAGNEWCTACHDDAGEDSWYPGVYPARSAPERDAAGYPVVGTWPGADAYAAPGNAHARIPESTQTAAASGIDVRRGAGDCLYCHAAHGGSNTYDGLLGEFRPVTDATLASDQANGDYAAACFDCHGGTVPSGFTTAPVDIKRLVTSTSPTSTAGHRVKTPGGTLPVGSPLPCYECHNPHGSSRGNGKLISDARGGGLLNDEKPRSIRAFCFTCHTASDTGRGWDSDSSAFGAVGATESVVGIPRSGGALRLPMMYQHEEAGTASCNDCHGYSELSPDNDVHNPRDPLASHTSVPASSDTISGSVTDYHDASLSYQYTCTQCHSADLTMEHFKSSTSTATLSGYATICLGCHNTKVSTFGGPWNGTCAGNGDACHATKHTDVAAGHDASAQVMAAPGSESEYVTNVATLVNEGWESGTYTTNGWTYAPITTVGPHSGTYTARLQASANSALTTRFWKEFDTSAYTDPTLEFWSNTAGLIAGDKIQVYYTTTGLLMGQPNVPWVPLYTPASGAEELVWTKHTYTLPRAKSVILLFTYAFVSSPNTARYVYYDDIKVTGTMQPAWTTTPVPAGSTATRSCGSGYLDGAANCHDVSDLGDIHARASVLDGGVTYTGCRVCHRDNATAPASPNCQNSGCHPGVNAATHSATYHESTFATDSAGPFAGTGFDPSWCTGCHFSGIAEEHRRLGAYASTGCAVCHKKSADTAAPLSITSADTSASIHADSTAGNALCTDCHKTMTKATPHVQSGPGTAQFDGTYTGHKVYSSQRGAVTSGVVGEKTITSWTLPATTAWLKTAALGGQPSAQLTPGSMVVCSDCHGSISGASGPHGATMQANYAINEATGLPYDNSYTSGALYVGQFSPDWLTSMSNTTALCNKCHVRQIDYNFAHTTGHHQGATSGKCINCHSPVPHAWKRPRLLTYTTDPAPYASQALTGIRFSQARNPLAYNSSTNPDGWDGNYCSTSCGGHSATMSAPALWP